MSAVIVIAVGSFLHFAWEWSGRSTLVAIFAATGESTWEHLKLAFWPALALTLPQRMILGACPGWLPATAIRCILPTILIVVLFYGYIAVLGDHHLVADIVIFALAIFAGEFSGHAVMDHEYSAGARTAALGLIVVATGLFSTLSFWPPEWFLFQEPPFEP